MTIAGWIPFALVLSLQGQDSATEMWRTEGTSPGAAVGQHLERVSDLDGDGVPDVLTRSPRSNSAFLTDNGALRAFSGADGDLLWELTGWRNNQRLGSRVAYPGDVDGDGVDDFILMLPEESTSGLVENGSVILLRGTDGTFLWQRDGLTDFEHLGAVAVVVADVNGDGAKDFAVGAAEDSSSGHSLNGRVELLSGRFGYSLWIARGTVDGEFLGDSLFPAGDVDGDGIEDLLSSSTRASTNGLLKNGTASMLSGATGALVWSFAGGADNEGWGARAWRVPDVNADGVDEVVLANPFAVTGGLYHNGVLGCFSGADGTQLWRLDGTAHDEQLGDELVVLGDVNGDGAADLALGIPQASPGGVSAAGEVQAVSGVNGATLWSVTGTAFNGLLGAGLAAFEDVDGDGLGEVLTVSPDADGNGTDSGFAMLLSGVSGATLWQLTGNPGERLGEAWLAGHDLNGDGHGDVLIGAPDADSGGTAGAGSLMAVDSVTGTLLWLAAGSSPQQRLGARIDVLGDADGDGVDDFLAPSNNADTGGLIDNGCLVALDGAGGTTLWQVEGTRSAEHFATRVLPTEDRDFDGFPDLFVASHLADTKMVPDGGYLASYSGGWLRHLELSGAVAGGSMTMDVVRATPGATIHFAGSLNGPGPWQVPWVPGLTVALSAPVTVVGNTTADPSGNASLSVGIPPALAGSRIWVQCVEQNGSVYTPTNLASTVVQ